MRNKLILTAAAVAAFTACSATVSATQIDGVINFAGNVIYVPPGTLSMATSGDTWNTSLVLNQSSGDFFSSFLITTGNATTMGSQWVFNPMAPRNNLIRVPIPSSPLFVVYNMQIGSIEIQNNDVLAIHTSGIIYAPGFDPTPGIFNFTSQGPATVGGNGTEYTWSGALGSVNRFQVPDGGTTALLFGSVLLVIGFLRNKLVA